MYASQNQKILKKMYEKIEEIKKSIKKILQIKKNWYNTYVLNNSNFSNMKTTTWTHPTTSEKRVYLNNGIWSNDVKVFINEKMEVKIFADWGVNKIEIENYVWEELGNIQSFEDVVNFVGKVDEVKEEVTFTPVKREIRKDISHVKFGFGEIIEEIVIDGKEALVVDFWDFTGTKKLFKNTVTIL